MLFLASSTDAIDTVVPVCVGMRRKLWNYFVHAHMRVRAYMCVGVCVRETKKERERILRWEERCEKSCMWMCLNVGSLCELHVCECVFESVKWWGREREGEREGGATAGVQWAKCTGRLSTLAITSSLLSIPPFNPHPPLPLLKAACAVTNQNKVTTSWDASAAGANAWTLAT